MIINNIYIYSFYSVKHRKMILLRSTLRFELRKISILLRSTLRFELRKISIILCYSPQKFTCSAAAAAEIGLFFTTSASTFTSCSISATCFFRRRCCLPRLRRCLFFRRRCCLSLLRSLLFRLCRRRFF